MRVVICERSIWSDKAVFADVNITDKAEKATYACTFEAPVRTLPPVRHATVLLDAPLEVCLARMQKRSRAAETDVVAVEGEESMGGVDAGYLSQLSASHHAYLRACEGPKRLVDATASPPEVANAVWAAIEDFRSIWARESPTSVFGLDDERFGHALVPPMQMMDVSMDVVG